MIHYTPNIHFWGAILGEYGIYTDDGRQFPPHIHMCSDRFVSLMRHTKEKYDPWIPIGFVNRMWYARNRIYVTGILFDDVLSPIDSGERPTFDVDTVTDELIAVRATKYLIPGWECAQFI